MGSFIRRRRPRANELGLQFTKGDGGVEAALFAPCGKGIPLRLQGMRPEWAITTARDLANELGMNVAVIDEAGVWDHVDVLDDASTGFEGGGKAGAPITASGPSTAQLAQPSGAVRFGKA